MKILALTWKHPQDPTAGGAERYLVEVTGRWADAGHDVTIFGPQLPGSEEPRGGGRGVKVGYVGEGSRLTVFGRATAYLRAQGTKFDAVLETVSTRPFGAHRMVGRKAVVLYHQTAEDVWNQEFPLPVALIGRYLLEPWWIRRLRGAVIVANSPSTAAALQRFGLVSQAVVPPGCDIPDAVEIRAGPSARPRLLWIGRMVRTKRPEDAIKAYALIRGRIPDATLDMAGAGYLQAMPAARDIPDVAIHGPVSELAKRALLAGADLLLLPGTREGWGIVAMEAASYGVPVVAYDIPGLRDAVVNGETGILVAPNPSALAGAAHRVLTDPALWCLLSQGARERALRFSWDQCAGDLLACLPPHCGIAAQGSASVSHYSTGHTSSIQALPFDRNLIARTAPGAPARGLAPLSPDHRSRTST